MPKTFTFDVKEQFIEMRAKGNTFADISEKLDVSKPTLIEWAKELQYEIENSRALEMEALQERYFATWKQRLEFAGSEFEKVKEEIEKRDYSDMTKKDLYEVALKLQAQLKDLERRPALKLKSDPEKELELMLNNMSELQI